jgi:hypothetical protein
MRGALNRVSPSPAPAGPPSPDLTPGWVPVGGGYESLILVHFFISGGDVSFLDFFAAVFLTLGPILLLIPAWRALARSPSGQGRKYPTVLLSLLTVSTLVYSITVFVAFAGFLMPWTVAKIAAPFLCTSVAVAVLSLIKVLSRPFGWILGESLILLFFWLTMALYH